MPYPPDPLTVRADGAPYLGIDQTNCYVYESEGSVEVSRPTKENNFDPERVTAPHCRLAKDSNNDDLLRWEWGWFEVYPGATEVGRFTPAGWRSKGA